MLLPERLDQLRRPEARRFFVPLTLVFLSAVALELRLLLDVDGIVDVDVVNFGLAAFRFNVIEAQPHPPGYPGYVLLLKLVHFVAWWLGPIDIAKWACRISSVATVPAAWWACRLALETGRSPSRPDPGETTAIVCPDETPPLWRPLASAWLAAVHPLLWYYGADGQSHGADALGALLLFAGAARVNRRGSAAACIGLAALFGLAGSLRPPLPVVMCPLLMWALWGRPLRVWFLSAAAGAMAVAAYFVPLVLLSGGWELYHRATRALVEDIFMAIYSPLGARASLRGIAVNLNLVLYGAAVALLPVVAWTRRTPDQGRSWRPALWSVVGLSILFYSMVFVRELGYFTGVAALALLVPATWRPGARWPTRCRRALLVVLLPAVTTLGPESLPAPFTSGSVDQPTLSHVVAFEKSLRHYRDAVCPWTSEGGLLVLSDNLIVTHLRYIPLACGGGPVLAAVHIFHPPYKPALDNWIVYSDRSLMSLPTPVPLELGPPAEGTLPRPIARVLVGHDSSTSFLREVAASARCAPIAGLDGPRRWPRGPVVWPARCIPELRLGQNVLRITRSP